MKEAIQCEDLQKKLMEENAKLKEENESLRLDLMQSERVINAKMDCIDELALRIEKLENELNTLSVLGKKKSWRPASLKPDDHGTVWDYGSLILLLNSTGETRKWVSKKNETPSGFLARILQEKQGANGQWLEYLIDELEEKKLLKI